jgi:hypothetical protein
MRKSLLRAALLALISSPAFATTYTISGPTDSFASVGDFAAVAGSSAASSPGQVFNLLDLSKDASGNESGSATFNMSSLWSTLNTQGLTSTSALVFGLGVNETGKTGGNSVLVTGLTMSFQRADGSTDTFTLGSNQFNVVNYTQGASTAEARIQVNLGFDFMAEYSGTSTKLFTIASTITGADDGNELYFLSGGFTAAPPAPVPASTPVPVPAAAWLLISGLLGFAGFTRRPG